MDCLGSTSSPIPSHHFPTIFGCSPWPIRDETRLKLRKKNHYPTNLRFPPQVFPVRSEMDTGEGKKRSDSPNVASQGFFAHLKNSGVTEVFFPKTIVMLKEVNIYHTLSVSDKYLHTFKHHQYLSITLCKHQNLENKTRI